jgi:hypothetical protein
MVRSPSSQSASRRLFKSTNQERAGHSWRHTRTPFADRLNVLFSRVVTQFHAAFRTERRLSLWSPQFFLCLVGWFKSRADSIAAVVYFFQKVLKHFSIVSKIVLHILWPVGLFEEFSYTSEKLRNNWIRIIFINDPDSMCYEMTVAVTDQDPVLPRRGPSISC